MKKIKDFKKTFNILKSIVSSDSSWEIKYDLIFSDEISKKLLNIHSFEWYDPDSSYQDDVLAFYNAAKEINENLSKISDDIYE